MRQRLLIATIAALLVLGAVPAFAAHTSGPTIVGDALTEEFGLEEDAVHDLQELGIGPGAIFKLQVYAIALGTDVETLLAGFQVDGNGDYVFEWGELKQTLTPEQLEILESLPRNLGQIVSASRRPDHAGQGKPEWAGEGKPPHAGGGDD
ncbi:MAG TPA: hypothetical protein VK960_07710 [Acidimicrobiia bacterium]|nr:hypothetical protein [Acidimicrobiia bacterium]